MKCKVCKEEINLTVLEYQTIHVGVVYKMNKKKVVDTNIKLSNEIAYLNISSTINYDSIKYSLNRLLEEKWVAIAILDHSENT
jgi:hypothetical protein